MDSSEIVHAQLASPTLHASPGAPNPSDDESIRKFAGAFEAQLFAPMIRQMTASSGSVGGIMEQAMTQAFADDVARDDTNPLYLQLRSQVAERRESGAGASP